MNEVLGRSQTRLIFKYGGSMLEGEYMIQLLLCC